MTDIKLPKPVRFIHDLLFEKGFKVYVVGGAVRDLLLDKEVTDWDFTTDARPEDITKIFPESFYDNSFGTVGVSMDHIREMMTESGVDFKPDEAWENQVFEVTTFRKEYGYSDKRRPDHIEWGDSIEDDLKRRDFTINAIALQVDSKNSDEINIIDPYQGKKDLADRLIRAVGSPQERFREDALRMMRAIRFGAQLGFVVETQTLEAINEQAELLRYISQERIRDELLKVIASDHPADGINILYNSGLLKYIIPELLDTRGVIQGGRHKYDVWNHSLESLRQCPSTDPIVRLATLLHDIGKPKTARAQGPRGVTFYGHEVVGARMAKSIGQRLRLPKKDVQRLFILVRWHMFTYNPEMTDAAIRRFIRRVGLENINDMMLLRVGDRKGGGSRATSWRLRELQQRIGENLYEPLSIRDLKITGHEVMEILEIKPGRRVGEVLKALFEEVLDDPGKNDPEYLKKRAKELT